MGRSEEGAGVMKIEDAEKVAAAVARLQRLSDRLKTLHTYDVDDRGLFPSFFSEIDELYSAP